MNLAASIDPHYTKTFEIHDQVVFQPGARALAAVAFDRLTIQSADADALRRLAEALNDAAGRIDALNATLAAESDVRTRTLTA